MWLLKPQPPTSNYNPNAVFVSHLMLALGGFLFALSPFEVAVDYRADSIISPWKLFVFGGEEENQSPQCKCQKWGGELMTLLDHTFHSGTSTASCHSCPFLKVSVWLPQPHRQAEKEELERGSALQIGSWAGRWLWRCNCSVQPPAPHQMLATEPLLMPYFLCSCGNWPGWFLGNPQDRSVQVTVLYSFPNCWPTLSVVSELFLMNSSSRVTSLGHHGLYNIHHDYDQCGALEHWGSQLVHGFS